MLGFPFYTPIAPIWYPSLTLQAVFFTAGTVYAISSYSKSRKVTYQSINDFFKAGE